MNSTNLHILIAEDEITHAVAIRRMLEKRYPDARIEVVGTVQEYKNRVTAALPTIALLDLNLTDGSTLEMLKAAAAPPLFPMIMMSSFASKQSSVDALQAGVVDFIIKTPEVFLTIGDIVAKTVDEWESRTVKNEAR